jgi:hypothetical protein
MMCSIWVNQGRKKITCDTVSEPAVNVGVILSSLVRKEHHGEIPKRETSIHVVFNPTHSTAVLKCKFGWMSTEPASRCIPGTRERGRSAG